MPLPTGTISMSQVNTELGRSATATISLGESDVRTLAGVPSGSISMDHLRGKSAVSVSISPAGGWSASNPINSHTFPTTSVTVTGGTASSYVWGFDFPGGGTWTVASGQGTATAAARVTGVFDSAYAEFYCDVTVNGQVYRVFASHSYLNTSGGGLPDF